MIALAILISSINLPAMLRPVSYTHLAAVWPGGNRACPLHVRDYHSPVSCDKTAVSYTHLDVYKRQYLCSKAFFFLNTARIAIPNALMTNKEVNRPTFV